MKRLTVIILSLVLSFGVVGCSSSSNDDSTQNQKDEQTQQKDTSTTSEISTLLKDMYIVLKDSDGGTKDCKDKLVNYGKDINNDMLANKDYGQDMQKLKDATENYDLEKIAKYVCDILNDIEGSDKYSIEIKSTDNTDKSNSNQNTSNKSNNTDKSNSDKNTSNKSSNTNQNTSNNTNKNTTNKNNNTNKNNDDEYQSGDYGDYTKCPNCKKMTFHPDGYCENCGYGKSANEDGASHSSECANCGSATINDDGTCPYCGYQN